MSTSRDEPGDRVPAPLDEVATYAALSRIAQGDRPLDQVLQEVVVLASRALPETPEVSVTLLDDDRPRTAAASGERALRLDGGQYDHRSGPCLDAAVSGETVRVTMDDPGASYPDFRWSALREGVTHSLSVGIPTPSGVAAALNLYSPVGSFAPESVRIAGTVAGVAGLALARAGREDEAAATATAAQLQLALASRVVINQAQGVLMARLRCSREQAFTRLVALAEEQGVRLREAAQTVVDQARRSS